ncbi:hypothetical protein [Flavilitoribacter nigricans]|uniref:GIY-YIG domain-containing protein n=1 Tax=Flavilitoribacter nigricans (strain ATCC 23147 / DSM 23189 / NBRC 102662 / NCIMB 1420 / SS-2) TaxID=1122177 RepID=A0A2D0NCP9_FLAN2|nr:hypothetical protein [Flavilitoribacter nigricans]PHN06150.1 hypothetical protein CRP01_11235 [Flavilitoribacter nigricans DSM 23189 = NBRC 102662]
MIYIIHFDEPLAHARHYVGYYKRGNLKKRLKEHRSGRGARILQVCNERGISYRVVRLMPGDRNRERQIKNAKCTPRYCPECSKIKKRNDMKVVRFAETIGKKKISFTYKLADHRKGTSWPIYGRVVFQGKNTEFRSWAMPDRYLSFADLEREQEKLFKEAQAITDLVRNHPDKDLKWGVNQYLNDENVIRHKLKDIRALNQKLCDNLKKGMSTSEALTSFVKQAESILK